MPEWALLSNHGLVLLFIAEKPHDTTREIAAELGIAERSVQRIVADLNLGGYITKEKVGRQNRYQVNRKKSLRHPTKKDKLVSHLLSDIVG